jgi:menaquinone-dependent protoporphyrinogen IX oxidase
MTAAPVLVAYATRYGSMQEVAEAVAATLSEGGLEVDFQPIARREKRSSMRRWLALL